MMRDFEPADLPAAPPELEEVTVLCRNCGNYEPCPCGEHGWCLVHGEYVDRDETMRVPRDCEDYA